MLQWAAIRAFIVDSQRKKEGEHREKALTSTEQKINHTIEQKITLFIELSSAVTRVANVPLSVACQKKKKERNNTGRPVAFNLNVLITLLQRLAENKAAHLSASCFLLCLSSLANQLYSSHNAMPSVPGVVGFGAWLRGGVFCVCACPKSKHTLLILNMHAVGRLIATFVWWGFFLTCVREKEEGLKSSQLEKTDAGMSPGAVTGEISQSPALLIHDGRSGAHVSQIFFISCDPFIIHLQKLLCVFVCARVVRVTPVWLKGGMRPVEFVSVVLLLPGYYAVVTPPTRLF